MPGSVATEALRIAGFTCIILGLTADSHRAGHVERAMNAGQDHVLSKPFTSVTEFRRILQTLIHDRVERGDHPGVHRLYYEALRRRLPAVPGLPGVTGPV